MKVKIENGQRPPKREIQKALIEQGYNPDIIDSHPSVLTSAEEDRKRAEKIYNMADTALAGTVVINKEGFILTPEEQADSLERV